MSVKYFLLALIALSLILMPNVMASDIQKLKAGVDGKVMVICESSGQMCGSTVVGNISIFYPNSSTMVDNKNLTWTPNYFYYSLNNNQTATLGQYTVAGFFNDGTNKIPYSFDYLVTRTGNVQTTSQGINSIAYLFLTLALTLICGYLSFRFSESKTFYALSIFFFVIATFFFIYDIWLGYEYKINYVGADNDATMFNTIFIIVVIMLSAGFIASLVMLIIRWKEVIKFVKSAIKEEKDDDGWDNNNFDSFKR